MKIVKKASVQNYNNISCTGNDCHCSNARCYAN